MIRVLIADDQVLVRSGFAMILDSDPGIEVAAQVADGAQAVTAARELHPDVVLMDIRMPVMDGIEATRHLTSGARTAGIRVLVLTTFDADEYVVEALRAGASGFLLKDTTPEELIRAVRVVADGEALLSPTLTRRMIEQFVRSADSTDNRDRPPRTLGEAPTLPPLTEREEEVLVAVANGLSNVEIAEQLVVSYSTVKTHVSHLLTKLDARDRVQLVIAAYRSGRMA